MDTNYDHGCRFEEPANAVLLATKRIKSHFNGTKLRAAKNRRGTM